MQALSIQRMTKKNREKKKTHEPTVHSTFNRYRDTKEFHLENIYGPSWTSVGQLGEGCIEQRDRPFVDRSGRGGTRELRGGGARGVEEAE